MSTLDTVRPYVEKLGWDVFPLPHGEKVPTTKGWQTTTIPLGALPQHFNGRPQNVGLKLSTSSPPMGDLDLDVPEAVRIAAHLAPETLTMGRASAPDSHRFYALAEPVTSCRFQIGGREAETLVEVRCESRKGTPQQTLIPPSQHPSGEDYVFSRKVAPVRIDGADLLRLGASVAAGVVFARLWPRTSGGRHDVALALSTVLLRSDLTRDEAEALLRAVCLEAGDEEIDDRLRCLAETAAAMDRGDVVTGGRALREALVTTEADGKALGKALEWIGFKSRTEAPREQETAESGTEAKAPRRAASDRAIGYVADEEAAGRVELWSSPERVPFISVPMGERGRANYPLRGRDASLALNRIVYDAEGKTLSASAQDDLVRHLEGRALFDGETHPTAVRVAEVGTPDGIRVYVDLGDDTGDVVEITASGWSRQPTAASPIRFVRKPGALALPDPQGGGKATDLARFLNVTRAGLALVLAWLVMAFRGRGPYPLLSFSGEQGTGKSTASRIVRSLVDPNAVPLRSLPKNERDAFVAAANTHVLVLDNLSGLSARDSDVLCRFSTGGGFSVRALYSDDEETLFEAVNPVILNGITDALARPDLADRAVAVELQPITDRRPEADLWADFEAARPAILGALFDAVAAGIGRLDGVDTSALPRMADFARMAVASEAALGLPSGAFLSAYDTARESLVDAAIDAEPVAALVRALRDEAAPEAGAVIYSGTPSELLDRLTLLHRKDDEKRRMPVGWPRNGRGLTEALKRSAPPLRAIGIDAQRAERTNRGQPWVLRQIGALPARPAAEPLAVGAAVQTPHGPGIVTAPPEAGEVSVEVDGLPVRFSASAVTAPTEPPF